MLAGKGEVKVEVSSVQVRTLPRCDEGRGGVVDCSRKGTSSEACEDVQMPECSFTGGRMVKTVSISAY